MTIPSLHEVFGSKTYSREEAAEDLENDVIVDDVIATLRAAGDQKGADLVASRLGGSISWEATDSARATVAHLLRNLKGR